MQAANGQLANVRVWLQAVQPTTTILPCATTLAVTGRHPPGSALACQVTAPPSPTQTTVEMQSGALGPVDYVLETHQRLVKNIPLKLLVT